MLSNKTYQNFKEFYKEGISVIDIREHFSTCPCNLVSKFDMLLLYQLLTIEIDFQIFRIDFQKSPKEQKDIFNYF